MHLLAAKPGGFVDDDGIVDLAQSPGDMVVLSAADSTLSALSAGLSSARLHWGAHSPRVRLANWLQLQKPAAYDLYEHQVLEQAKVVVLSLLGGASYWAYGLERLVEWQHADQTSRTLVVVPGDDQADPELFAAGSVSQDDAVTLWRYLRAGGEANATAFWHFIAARYLNLALDLDAMCPRPVEMPSCQIYCPTSREVVGVSDTASVNASSATVLLLFYRSHLQSANTAMFDALIESLSNAGLRVLPVAVSSLKDASVMAQVNHWIEEHSIRLILNTTGFASHTARSPDLSSNPWHFENPFANTIPVLQLIVSSSALEDWQTHTQGLRSRDIAMQVVLPEMDGRIVTRAISFKAESHYDAAAQIAVVRYQLHRERADFVAQLAWRYVGLSAKPNAEKRIALILANYPTKDGRIGNGVGLDTPASALNILNALQAQAYSVADLPESGNGLIEALLGAITNNPETLHARSCWQSLAVSDYLRYFAQLPEVCQRWVWERWGPPEKDPKYRQGRLMLAGIRLGETFVGIQPARGFNLDLAANYHDPDLVPPHSYLAFYFWLRHVYQVDAFIHVGKHGNLEWLPGKGLALSEQCWPDIALGPMPHFYPFIVNDPGEGAQAKRRTQAVIIDHLMPPMTRAETYGELAELETLVDEYYQAQGMDNKRESWLRQAILDKVAEAHVREELGLATDDNDDEILNRLDAYLCDIKEAQIRHGLHILGALPGAEKLADTLVALLRLPRGDSPCSQGILHNLAADLDLHQNGERFDPLAAGTALWHGPRPAILASQSQALWRTEADTRDRLEKLALSCIENHVIGDSKKTLLAELPRTGEQLTYAREVILKALNDSARQELAALLGGLSGGFVEPGPSGAPTRGRLDTLPTGRNFYSVDNRAIPSPAAWAIGQRAAQAMLERHLQEHGEYPRQLGLSVWGTSTMRTGGDDIAQAFALMGVEPVWAAGSHRVTDFKVIGTQAMRHPRVDVTLRVSGFFRDAFPNVMKLFDAAVQAIADIEEPGNENIIQQNVRARQAELQAQGYSPQEAYRQATYRVFGSKPGAYGAGLQGLIDERCWSQRGDLADAYLNWGGYAYGNQPGDGVAARDAFAYQLSRLDVVAQNQDNREHDILDSDDYYQFQGGMTNAVRVLKGEAPTVYHNDLSNPSAPKVRTLKEELNRVLRSRVLNPKWMQAMREHGYKGAFEMAASVDYLFAYDATTDLVDDYQYAQVTDSLLLDSQNQTFLREQNPNALMEMAERLLEATQRGLWQNPGDRAEALQNLLLDLDEQQEGAP